MFGLNPWLLVGAGGIALLLSTGAYFKGDADAANRYQLRIDAIYQQANLVADAEAEQANLASTAYERGRAKSRILYRNITKEIDHVIEASTVVYSRECFDAAGLQLANDALTRSQAPPGKSPDGMSRPFALGRRDGGDDPAEVQGRE